MKSGRFDWGRIVPISRRAGEGVRVPGDRRRKGIGGATYLGRREKGGGMDGT